MAESHHVSILDHFANLDNPRVERCPAYRILAGLASISFAGSSPFGLAPLLGSVGAVAGDVKLQDDGVVHHRVMAAAVAMGLAKMRSHSEKTRFDVMPRDLRS